MHLDFGWLVNSYHSARWCPTQAISHHWVTVCVHYPKMIFLQGNHPNPTRSKNHKSQSPGQLELPLLILLIRSLHTYPINAFTQTWSDNHKNPNIQNIIGNHFQTPRNRVITITIHNVSCLKKEINHPNMWLSQGASNFGAGASLLPGRVGMAARWHATGGRGGRCATDRVGAPW